MPTSIGPAEHERMRLHLRLHLAAWSNTITADELLQHFEVKARKAR
jgi:hypothetical protein